MRVHSMNTRVMIDPSTRYGLLKILADNPDLSQRDLAKRLGVSLGKINYCLNAQVGAGCLKVGNCRNSKLAIPIC